VWPTRNRTRPFLFDRLDNLNARSIAKLTPLIFKHQRRYSKEPIRTKFISLNNVSLHTARAFLSYECARQVLFFSCYYDGPAQPLEYLKALRAPHPRSLCFLWGSSIQSASSVYEMLTAQLMPTVTRLINLRYPTEEDIEKNRYSDNMFQTYNRHNWELLSSASRGQKDAQAAFKNLTHIAITAEEALSMVESLVCCAPNLRYIAVIHTDTTNLRGMIPYDAKWHFGRVVSAMRTKGTRRFVVIGHANACPEDLLDTAKQVDWWTWIERLIDAGYYAETWAKWEDSE